MNKREKEPKETHRPPVDYVVHHPKPHEEPLATERDIYQRTRSRSYEGVSPSVKVAL
jgi:hypothetical protein